jgi:four helix bundle protein
MDAAELKARTRSFALRVLKLSQALPKTRSADVVARQMFRSATSVAANYRAACPARSRAEFVAKLGIVQEEADETLFWIEFADEAGWIKTARIEGLLKGCNEMLAIVVASRKTAKSTRRHGRGNRQ